MLDTTHTNPGTSHRTAECFRVVDTQVFAIADAYMEKLFNEPERKTPSYLEGNRGECAFCDGIKALDSPWMG